MLGWPVGVLCLPLWGDSGDMRDVGPTMSTWDEPGVSSRVLSLLTGAPW